MTTGFPQLLFIEEIKTSTLLLLDHEMFLFYKTAQLTNQLYGLQENLRQDFHQG